MISIGTNLAKPLLGESPNFAQELVDELFEELGLKLVLTMDELDVLPNKKEDLNGKV